RARLRHPDGARGGSVRRGRHPGRDAREPCRRLVGRRPVALPGRVRAIDGRAPADRGSGGARDRMSAQQLIGGTARALTRRLSRTSDRLALYAALTDGGRRTDTLMIETLAGPSLIVEQAAVRIECRGQEATLTALTANGRNVLPAVATSLAHVVTEQAPSLLRLTFPRTKSEDAETGLLAPCPFD